MTEQVIRQDGHFITLTLFRCINFRLTGSFCSSVTDVYGFVDALTMGSRADVKWSLAHVQSERRLHSLSSGASFITSVGSCPFIDFHASFYYAIVLKSFITLQFLALRKPREQTPTRLTNKAKKPTKTWPTCGRSSVYCSLEHQQALLTHHHDLTDDLSLGYVADIY